MVFLLISFLQRRRYAQKMTHASVSLQIPSESSPSIGEVAAFAHILTLEGSLKAITEQVRFARARFGHDDPSDFVAVLIGDALSGEPTLLAFDERLAPFAEPFMALFGRQRLPSSFHPISLSRSSRLELYRSPPAPLSKGCVSMESLPVSRRTACSDRCAMARDQRGWSQGYRPPTRLAANRRLARSPSPV